GGSTPADFKGEHSDSEAESEDAKENSSEDEEDDDDNADDDGDETSIPASPKKKYGPSSSVRGIDTSSTIPHSDLIHLQAQLDRALKENARL
ncbi:hypothetical protein Dimus_007859, partial [Dionaea muscipula]